MLHLLAKAHCSQACVGASHFNLLLFWQILSGMLMSPDGLIKPDGLN
jgi:hypothetical protein